MEATLPCRGPGRDGSAHCASHAKTPTRSFEEELVAPVVVQRCPQNLVKEVGGPLVQVLGCLLRHRQGAQQMDVGSLRLCPGQDENTCCL
jgi:hypothetical protein